MAEWISAVVAAAALLVSAVSQILAKRHDKKQDTIEAFARLQNEALDKLTFYSPGRIAEISRNSRSEEYKTLSLYLARLEHFSVGVNKGIYDEKTAYALAGELLGPLYDKLLPLIEAKRKIPNEGKVYDDFEQLAGKMKNLSRKG